MEVDTVNRTPAKQDPNAANNQTDKGIEKFARSALFFNAFLLQHGAYKRLPEGLRISDNIIRTIQIVNSLGIAGINIAPATQGGE